MGRDLMVQGKENELHLEGLWAILAPIVIKWDALRIPGPQSQEKPLRSVLLTHGRLAFTCVLLECIASL